MEQTNFHLRRSFCKTERLINEEKGHCTILGMDDPRRKKVQNRAEQQQTRQVEMQKNPTTRQLNFPEPNKIVRINAKHLYKIISFNPSAIK